jgi:hypothetical protein
VRGTGGSRSVANRGDGSGGTGCPGGAVVLKKVARSDVSVRSLWTSLRAVFQRGDPGICSLLSVVRSTGKQKETYLYLPHSTGCQCESYRLVTFDELV